MAEETAVAVFHIEWCVIYCAEDCCAMKWMNGLHALMLWGAGNCKVALLAIQLADRTTTYDTSNWTDVVESGSLVYNQCVAHTERERGVHVPSGGYALTGKLTRLY